MTDDELSIAICPQCPFDDDCKVLYPEILNGTSPTQTCPLRSAIVARREGVASERLVQEGWRRFEKHQRYAPESAEP